MKEIVIRHFFEGCAAAAELAAEAADALDRRTDSAGTVFSRLNMRPMESEFDLEPQHLVALVDAVLAGTIDLAALEAIAFAVEASDHFLWDTDTEGGDRVARALFLLGAPEINYPLTTVVLRKIKHLLESGEETFDAADQRPPEPRPHLISEKSWHRDPDV